MRGAAALCGQGDNLALGVKLVRHSVRGSQRFEKQSWRKNDLETGVRADVNSNMEEAIGKFDVWLLFNEEAAVKPSRHWGSPSLSGGEQESIHNLVRVNKRETPNLGVAA